jgi:hypothetical protein
MDQDNQDRKDFFAGLAMVGILSASGDQHGRIDYDEVRVARYAYDLAEAMIEERRARSAIQTS